MSTNSYKRGKVNTQTNPDVLLQVTAAVRQQLLTAAKQPSKAAPDGTAPQKRRKNRSRISSGLLENSFLWSK